MAAGSRLPVTRVAVALLGLPARTARARRVPPHLGVVGAVGRGAPLLHVAAPVFAGRAVLQAARPLRAVQAAGKGSGYRRAFLPRRGLRAGLSLAATPLPGARPATRGG